MREAEGGPGEGRSGATPRPLLFLSHAGVDSDRAEKLVDALKASPAAQAAGLKVWFDKRDLRLGTSWQEQLENAIDRDATAFGLFLTKAGALNWVRLEVRVALDRVVREKRAGRIFPFVPIIVDDPGHIDALPPFARQYQGVTLGSDHAGIADLIQIAAGLTVDKPVALVAEPFVGLGAFDAEHAALFFGRREEAKALVERLKATNFVVVVGDSGSGKSSVVKAGLIPAFREGAFSDPRAVRPNPALWHVIEMRPGRVPFDGLIEGVRRAAEAAGKSAADRGTLYDWVRTRKADKIVDALRDCGPAGASVLLVVDQLEELWTLTTDDEARQAFIRALLAVAPAGDASRRVVATMRRDYWHQHTDDDALAHRLAADGAAGRFLLPPISDVGLREAVEKPLLLAGQDESRARALADEIVKDIQGQPGNLALVQMALFESWQRRGESGGDLALAYQRLDRLEGALAHAAEDVFWNPSGNAEKLTADERRVAEALFMRLVRAGDAGGATRRPVSLSELTPEARGVAQKLATPACQRLLVIGGTESAEGGDARDGLTVELAHEQLATQWPDYRFWLRGTKTSRHDPDPRRATDKRAFDRLIDAAARWHARGGLNDDLARGGDLSDFERLWNQRRTWLSPVEKDFVRGSVDARDGRVREREKQLQTAQDLARSRTLQVWGASVAALLLLAVAIFAGLQWVWAGQAEDRAVAAAEAQREARIDADTARAEADANALRAEEEAGKAIAAAQDAIENLQLAQWRESLRIAALVNAQAAAGHVEEAMGLALYALPRDPAEPDRPFVPQAVAALQAIFEKLPLIASLRGHGEGVSSAAFSPDGELVVTASTDRTARVWQLISLEALIATACRLVPEGASDALKETSFITAEEPVCTGVTTAASESK